MNKVSGVSLNLASGTKNEYIIRDKLGITIGRIIIIDISNENKVCISRIKFYKEDYEGMQHFEEAIGIFMNLLFNEKKMYKVDIIADEEVFLKPFTNKGFMLEGIMTNNIIYKKLRKSEVIFGISYDMYSKLNTLNVLRLYGENIILKILTIEDTEDVLQYYKRNKKHLEKFEPKRDESFYSFEVQKQMLVEDYKQFINGSGAYFGIYKKGYLIGKIQISSIVYGVFKSGIVGYSIDRDEQGNGYMHQALNIVINYCFEEMDLHRIEASTLVDNYKSQGVLKRCGFEKLGLNKQYLFINGKWRDHITFYRVK
ncbi:MAG: GNAT family protein [Clostridium sp.]|nr:GNAT family protein [Clostridium sp.]